MEPTAAEEQQKRLKSDINIIIAVNKSIEISNSEKLKPRLPEKTMDLIKERRMMKRRMPFDDVHWKTISR